MAMRYVPLLKKRSIRNPDSVKWLPPDEAAAYLRAGWHRVTPAEWHKMTGGRHGKLHR